MKYLQFLACCVLLFVLATPAIPSPAPFSGEPITRIDLVDDQGRPWPRPEQLLPLIPLKPRDKLTGAAVREAIATLHLKGLFRDIRVEAVADHIGVRVVFTLTRKTIIEAIDVSGAKALSSDTVRDLLAPVRGKELRLDRLNTLKADLLERYQAEGHMAASVSFHTRPAAEPSRVILEADIREGEPTLISAITFSGLTVFTERELLRTMESRPGKPLRRDVLLDTDREAIIRKYGVAGYPAAQAGPVDIRFEGNAASILVQLSEGPRVVGALTGNKALKDAALLQSLLIWSEHDVSDAVVESSAERIRSFYRQEGYADAAVEVKRTASPGRIDLEFVVQEGPRIGMEKVILLGNEAFATTEITAQMAQRESGWFRMRPYREDLLDKDVDNLRDRYQDAGYLSAVVRRHTVFNAAHDRATAVIDITEGPQTRTGDIAFDGNTVFTSPQLLERVNLKPGAPFNERTVDEDRYRILSAYANSGHLYARVDVEKTARNGITDVRYRIVEDRPVMIGRIILRGNERTRDPVILRELLVKPGDAYDYGAMLTSQQRIYRLGYFRVARFEPIRPGEKEYVKDLLFTAEERNAGAMELGAGYGDLDRLRGFVELSHRNLWGTARYTSLRFEQSDILKRAIFNFHEPWLLDRRLDGKFSLVWSDSKKLNSDTRDIYYQTRKTVASFGIERSYERLKPSITYQFENVRNYDVRPEALLTPEDSGRVLISSLSPALVWDLRDDAFNPHSGMIAGVVLKEALRELQSEADFSKLTLQAGWFIPLDTNVLALSARAGAAWPFRATNEVPIHERFTVGGSTTVRGYTQDSIGPNALDSNGNRIPQGGQGMAVFNIEFRLNPGEGLGIELFVDAGNVWPDQVIRPDDLRASYGIGIRYGTPVGPFRLDYGQKIDRQPGESPGEVHFSIGNTF